MSELLDTWRHSFVKAIKDKYAARYSSHCSHSWDYPPHTHQSELGSQSEELVCFSIQGRERPRSPLAGMGQNVQFTLSHS